MTRLRAALGSEWLTTRVQIALGLLFVAAALPKLANMKLDLLLLTPDTFAVIEAKLHSPVQASQIHLQQVLGVILSRLPGYERHTFRHFLVSRGTHPKLGRQVGLCRPPVNLSLQECSWEQILKCLPRVAPHHRAEIQTMLAPRRRSASKL